VTTSASPNKLAAAPRDQGPKNQRQLKILEFYTDWCHVCKEFSPVWNTVASRVNGRADMRQLNAEDDSNAALKSKYNVSSYPHIIFTDDSGVV